MFCIKCGTKNDANSKFCENCGAELSQIEKEQNTTVEVPATEVAPTTQNETEEIKAPIEEKTEVQEETVQPADSETPSELESVAPENELEQGKKSGKARKAILIAAAICVLGVLFWDSVLAAVAPKIYAQTVLTRTIDKVNDEIMKSEKNLLGFDVEKEKEVTASIEGILNEVAGKEFDGIGFRLTAKDSQKKKKFMYDAEMLYGGDTLLSAQFMLDDKNIYVNSPELFKKSLSIPSKGFGKAWNESDLADEIDVELSEDLDLSYSELLKKQTESLLTKKSDKAIKKQVERLIKASSVKTSKGSASVNGKTVTTKAITVAIDPDDLEERLSAMIDIIEEDENVKKAAESSKEAEDAMEELFDGVREVSEGLCDAIDGEIVLELQVYNGDAVNIAFEFEVEGGVSIRIETAFEDSKTFINDMNMLVEIKGGGQKVVIEISSEGNHIAKGKVFTDETVFEVKAAGQKIIELEHSMTMDMKKKEYEQEFTAKAEGKEFGFSLGGTCSNKKEFKLVIDKFKIKGGGSKGIAEFDPKIKGELTLTIVPEAKFEKVNTSDSLNILAVDEDDAQKWAEDVGEKTEKFVEKNEEVFESMSLGGEEILPQSYSDYYYE